MIVIEINNHKEIVHRERGAIAARLGPLVTDIEAAVEEQIIAEVQQAFLERGINARVLRVPKGRLKLNGAAVPAGANGSGEN